jgi:chromate transporter
MKNLLKLFATFFKIGLFTFGGGYAMISFIEDECVNKHKFISEDEMKEIVILSESTPGPIAVNAATFVGFKVNKVLGSVMATLGVILPSLIIITLISIFLKYFQDNQVVTILFEAIRACVTILMAKAFLNLIKSPSKNIEFYALLITSFILNFFFSVKAIYIILFAFLYTVIILTINKFKNKKEVKDNA